MTPATDPRPCLCGTCGRTYRRPRSFPLCADADRRAWAVCRSLYGDAGLAEQSRINARFWIDEETVTAALRGDRREVARRVAFRAQHGLYSDPDRAQLAIGA